ncbi:MAG: hypothetical protein IKJ24_03745 [Clostridia bacterium]|nr:hypothetical protein [Clostridia bacterium]
MNAKDLFKRFITRGAVIYTAGSLFILLFSLMLPENSAAKILSPTPFLFFAIFAYILSLGSALYASGRFYAPIARLIHAACYNLGFLCFLIFCSVEFAYAAIFTAVFAIIYTASVLIAGSFKKKLKATTDHKQTAVAKPEKVKKAKSKPETTYTSRFS